MVEVYCKRKCVYNSCHVCRAFGFRIAICLKQELFVSVSDFPIWHNPTNRKRIGKILKHMVSIQTTIYGTLDAVVYALI